MWLLVLIAFKTLIHFDFDPLIIGRGKISNGIHHITNTNLIDQ